MPQPRSATTLSRLVGGQLFEGPFQWTADVAAKRIDELLFVRRGRLAPEVILVGHIAFASLASRAGRAAGLRSGTLAQTRPLTRLGWPTCGHFKCSRSQQS